MPIALSLISGLVRRISQHVFGGGVVVAGFIGLGSMLSAAQVEWSVNVSLPSLDSSIYFNPITGETSSSGSSYLFAISNFSGSGYNQTVINGTLGEATKVIYDGGPDAKNLSSDSLVNDEGPFWGSANLVTYLNAGPSLISNFAADEVGYIGLTFVDNEQTYYGWASIVRGVDSTLVTLTGFGYNSTAGEASTIGASPIPEPASFGVLAAMGALVVCGLRRRRARS
jgi:hypothetical protein